MPSRKPGGIGLPGKLIVLVMVLIGCLMATLALAAPQFVIQISIDGLGSSYLNNLIDANQVPNLKRLQTEGAGTLNARNDYDSSETLPNHVTMITARGVYEGVYDNTTTGHFWSGNVNPAPGQTIQSNKGSYVASVFDVAHDSGLRTALYATKSKFSLFQNSYPTQLDAYEYNSSSAVITSDFLTAMGANPFNYTFIHYADPDVAGHTDGWGSASYNNAVIAIDGYLGQIFNLVNTHAALQGHTAIILTADHGGVGAGAGHDDPSNPLTYTIPFYVWGPGVSAGADLYALNPGRRLDPGASRPLYSAPVQPIRNGDGANLSLSLLGLGPIPGSTLNLTQNLAVDSPYADITPINYGDSINGSISTAGEEDTYSFVGQAGDEITLYFDNTSGSSFNARLVLRRPDGTVLKQTFYTYLDQVISDLVLPANGAYTVLVDGEEADKGNYTLRLKGPKLLPPGLNLIHPGPGPLTCQELLDSLGTPEEVDSLYRLDAPTQRFERCNPQAGINFAIRLGEGYMVLMRKAWQTPIAPSPTCPEFNLSAGVNLIGHPKPPENLTCFSLLKALGAEMVSVIQRYDTKSGAFGSCTFFSTAGNTSQPAGVNFPIIAGEGYLLHLRMPGVVSLPGCGD